MCKCRVAFQYNFSINRQKYYYGGPIVFFFYFHQCALNLLIPFLKNTTASHNIKSERFFHSNEFQKSGVN